MSRPSEELQDFVTVGSDTGSMRLLDVELGWRPSIGRQPRSPVALFRGTLFSMHHLLRLWRTSNARSHVRSLVTRYSKFPCLFLSTTSRAGPNDRCNLSKGVEHAQV